MRARALAAVAIGPRRRPGPPVSAGWSPGLGARVALEELRPVYDAFVRDNAQETNPNRLHALRYMLDVTTTDEEVWVLLGHVEADPTVIVVLSTADGTQLRRLSILGVRAHLLAPDPAHGRLYFATSEDAQILSVPIGR